MHIDLDTVCQTQLLVFHSENQYEVFSFKESSIRKIFHEQTLHPVCNFKIIFRLTINYYSWVKMYRMTNNHASKNDHPNGWEEI